MTSGTNLKKKRKAAKKKKKKQLSNKNKGEDDRKSEEIGDGDGLDEECGSSSVGVDLDSESGDGSGNGRGNKAETELEDEDDKELSVGAVGDSGILRGLDNHASLDHEQAMFLEKMDSTQESVKPKRRIDSVQGVVEDIPIQTTAVLNGNGLSEDTIVSSQVEDIRIDKSKVSSVDTPTVGIKEDDYTESSQNQANVPFAQPMLQQTTWKCCCGLFEVFAGSNR